MLKDYLFPSFPIYMLLIPFIFLSSLGLCFGPSTRSEYVARECGVSTEGGTVIHESDDHGGFLGDGEMLVFIQFDDDGVTETMTESNHWRLLPLEEELHHAIYNSFHVDMPEVTNGYYYFRNRKDDVSDRYNPAYVDVGSSWNFTAAIFDLDTNILYYIEEDT